MGWNDGWFGELYAELRDYESNQVFFDDELDQLIFNMQQKFLQEAAE